MKVTIREFKPGQDEAFVYSTWQRGDFYKNKDNIDKYVKQKKGLWFAHKSEEIRKILETATVKIACLESDPYVIAGYIVINGNKLEHSYVKSDYRGNGIEELLLKQRG